MDERDFINVEHARAAAFNMFTALLCQPEASLVQTPRVFDALRLGLNIVDVDSATLVNEMQEAAKQSSAQDLLIEYTRLFIGPFKALAPPYSSLYLGYDTLMSDEAVWVLSSYRKSGLKFDEAVQDVPDHVAVETEFMYHLIHKETRELEAGNRDGSLILWQNQREFFSRHYRKWVPIFCTTVATETNNAYFKALSKCLSKFICSVEIPPFPDKVAAIP
jgi:TorA maturation chaperone TorD